MKPEKIIELVCDHLGISECELGYRTRKSEIVKAREYCFFLIHYTSPMTFKKIGKLFNRTHGTVISGIRTLQDRMDTEPVLFKSVYSLLDIIDDYNKNNVVVKEVDEPMFQENDWYV